jgi:Flp pilus assembly protein TadB
MEETAMSQTPMLASERVVVQAPMSYHGSWIRTWRLMDFRGRTGTLAAAPRIAAGVALVVAGLVMLAGWWVMITAWYLFFGLWLVPYRLIRRGSRKRKMENLRHRELLNTMQMGAATTAMPNASGAVVLPPSPATSQPTLEDGAPTQLPPGE